MSHIHHFQTINNQELDITVDQIRHIEFTSDEHGENIIVLHKKDTGKEFTLDGENRKITDEMNLLLREAGIY